MKKCLLVDLERGPSSPWALVGLICAMPGKTMWSLRTPLPHLTP